MFSLVCALPSPASAEGCPPLFGWFTGSTAQSDFSGTCMSAVRFVAFADRPWSWDQGVLEISRFSCMLFLSVRGFLDYAGPTVHSRLAWLPCCLPPTRNEVGILIYGLFAAQSPRPPMPLFTLQETSRDVSSKTRGQDGFATSFPVGLLHPLQHAGLSRRSPVCPLYAHNREARLPRRRLLGKSTRFHLAGLRVNQDRPIDLTLPELFPSCLRPSVVPQSMCPRTIFQHLLGSISGRDIAVGAYAPIRWPRAPFLGD